MGILDDLAMGFGMKERTADYDARTAKTIAAREASQAVRAAGGGDHASMVAGLRARQKYDPQNPTGRSAAYLNRINGVGYRPQIAQDDRPFMQRLLTSPQGAPSPNPYAIGPVSMDKPLPRFGLLGLFTDGLSSIFNRDRDPRAAINVGERAMGMLPAGRMVEAAGIDVPTEITPPVVTNVQPEDTLEELTSPLSDVPLQPVLNAPTVTGSGKYPQFLYERGYSDLFLDSLPKADLDFLLSFDPTIP